MNPKRTTAIVAFVAVAVLTAVVGVRSARTELPPPNTCTRVPRPPRIHPDYADTTIPPNLAPLRFVVKEAGLRYGIRISSAHGPDITVTSPTDTIAIPTRKWRALLKATRGKSFFIHVFVKNDEGVWQRYDEVETRVAEEDIDSHLVYRVLGPNFNHWSDISIHQRDITGWGERPIITGGNLGRSCVNCHTFRNNDPSSMFFGIRGPQVGSSTLLSQGNQADKIDAKWGYTAWHPSGRLAVYAVIKVRQFFHLAGMEVRDVVDLDSALHRYDIGTGISRMCTEISDPLRLETYPTWTPDGRTLYYCSAPVLWDNRDRVPPPQYHNVKYDLRKVQYDIETGAWSAPETVLSAKQTGMSILLPRVSPDGRFLLFCMCDYGCFPVYQPSSDLYMMDLKTGTHKRLPINSPFSESWHSWSSNSRWIAFSSKRNGGLFTRLYISYVDSSGTAHKPFVLPHKDPEFYDSFLKTYSMPELVTGPVPVSRRALIQAARSRPSDTDDRPPTTGATPSALKPAKGHTIGPQG